MIARFKKNIGKLVSVILILAMAFQSIAAPLSSMNPAAASEPAKITGTWSTDASGSWHFNAPDGAAKDGWYYLNTTNNATDYNWFCFDANGVMRTGWVPDKNDPSVWYYTGETKDSSEGGLVKGWITDPQDGQRYYLDPSTGIMCHGWKQIDGVWYYFTESRYADRGWAPDTKGYWVDKATGRHSHGSLYVNERTPDGYYVGITGAWLVNGGSSSGGSYTPPASPAEPSAAVDVEKVTVKDNGKLQAGEGEVSITSGDEKTRLELPKEKAVQLAEKINTMLDSAPVAQFTGTGLKESSKIDTTEGLQAIINELQARTGDETAKNSIGSKTASDIDLQIKIVLSNVNIITSNDLTVTSMEFEVTPIASTTVKDSNGDTITVSTEIKTELSEKVKFRLPIDSSLAADGNKIAVYHEGEFFGNYEIQGVTPNTYIEIESRNFSKFGYSVLNVHNAAAKIGDTLYFKFADAVESVGNEETITLLKPAVGKVTINREVTFTVDKNGRNFNATVKSAAGYNIRQQDVSESSIVFTCKKQVTVTFNMNGHGTQIAPITGVVCGAKISAPAAPEAEGYTFGGWYKEAACTNAWSFDTDTVTADTTLYAKWTIVPSTFGIIVEDDGHGTAKAQVGDVDATTVAPGATVKLVATANDGYAFKEWQIDRGLEAGAITDNTFTMPSNEVKVKAVFEKEYAVEVEAGGHGTVSADVAKGVSGKTVNLTITPDEGYEVDQITVVRGGVTVESNKFKIGTADVKIRVTFKAIVPSTYGIIVEDDGHGTASADPTSAAPGTNVTLTATPNDGYAFEKWEIVRGLEAGAITDNSFTMPSNEVKVKAVFEKEYAVEAEAGGHGTVSADVAKGVSGKEVNLTITPDAGYEKDQITVVRGGVTVTGNQFTIGTADVKIRVTFKAIVPATYGIIVEDDGHGTAKAQVGGEDVSAAAPEANVTLSATANDGYAFKEWQIVRGLEAGAITDNTFTMPSKEVKVKAIFERVYNITLQTNEHGTASATVGGETATTAAANVEVTLTATPAEGYQFKEWKTVSGGVTVTDNKFTMPAGNVTIQAVFEAILETKKLSEILPSGFPESADTAWVNADGLKAYRDDDTIKVGNLTLGKDTTVTKSGDNYVCKSGDATVTFNVKGGAAESVTVTGSTDSDGTYAAPTFKAVYNTAGDANTLTFYYDNKDHSGEGITVYGDGITNYLFDNSKSSGAKWGYHKIRSIVKSVKIDSSVADYKDLTSTAYMFQGMTMATNISGAEYLDVSNVKDMSFMFQNFGGGSTNSPTTLNVVPDVSNWNTGNVKIMSGMFESYGNFSSSLEKVPDVNNWNTGNVTDMLFMFQKYGHESQTFNAVPDVSKWNTGNVTNMQNMFMEYGHKSTSLGDVPSVSNWDTASVTNMSGMFYGYGKSSTALAAVPVVSKWNTGNVTTMADMFHEYGASSTALTAVPDVSSWNTDKVTTILNMFRKYGNGSVDFELDLSGWDLSKITGTNGNNVFNFNPSTFNVTIPAKTREKSNEIDKWYYGDGTNHIAPPTDKTFKTVADVLATAEGGFPTSPEEAWLGSKTGYCCYIADDYLKIGSDGILLAVTKVVSGGGESFTYSGNYVTFTFNMTNGKLTSIMVSGSNFALLDDTYEPAVSTMLTLGVSGGQTHDAPMAETEVSEPTAEVFEPELEPEKFEEAKPEELIEPAEAVAEEAAP